MAGIPMEKIKPVLILTGILALLLIILLVTGEADKDEGRRVDSLVSMEADTISSLEIRTGEGSPILFSKTDKGWIIEEPLYSLASEETMQSVIETVDKLVGVPMELDPSLALEEYGLEGGDVITVTAVSRDGHEESFSLGKQIPLDVGYVYTYIPASGNFYKAYKDAREVFTLPIEEYRDRTVVDLSMNSIESIELSGVLTGEMSPIIVEKQPPWWELTAPEAASGNNGKVKNLLEGIISLRASDFPKSYEDAVKTEPELRIEFTLSNGETEAVAFFGSYGDDLQYVAVDGIPYALGIPGGVVNNLPVSFDQLRSKAVLRFDPDGVQEIMIKTETDEFELRRDERGWRLAGEQDLPVEDAAVKHLISLLTMTDVENLPESMDVNKKDIAMQLKIGLREENGDEYTVELGEASDEGVVPGFSSFRDRPFIVPADFFDRFQIDRDYFEDKHLLSFESRDVGSIRIQGKTGKIIIEKSGSDWLLTEPERAAADSPKSWGLVFALEKLVYTDRASIDDFNSQGFAADEADYRIQILDSDGREQGSLDLWVDKNEGEIFAASKARDGLFVIDSELLDKIPEDHTELIYRR